MNTSNPRYTRRVFLPLVLCISTAVIVVAFNPAPHNGGDNAAYVTLAFSLAEHGTYTDLYDPAEMPHTKYPPVFPGLLALMLLLGARTWSALKTVSAVFTIAAVGFTYLWAERRLGAVGALGLSVMLAISPALVYYSHWILSDPIFLCFTMAALWALERSEQESASVWWLVGGVATVGLAYFTRSAGLPLLFALFGWLALRRKWLPLTFSSIAMGVPALLWWIRGRGEGIGEYTSEFWMVDPYQPALGTVSFGGLLARAFSNFCVFSNAFARLKIEFSYSAALQIFGNKSLISLAPRSIDALVSANPYGIDFVSFSVTLRTGMVTSTTRFTSESTSMTPGVDCATVSTVPTPNERYDSLTD